MADTIDAVVTRHADAPPATPIAAAPVFVWPPYGPIPTLGSRALGESAHQIKG